MPESSMPWVKVYTDILDDPKIGRLSDAAKWRFIQLIVLAGECDAEGLLVMGESPMPHEDIAWRLRVDATMLTADIQTLSDVGVIDRDPAGVLRVVNFAKRQGRSQTERRAQWRERAARARAKRDSQVDSPETPENVTGESRANHAPRGEERRVEESRGEESVTAPESGNEKIARGTTNPMVREYVLAFGKIPNQAQSAAIIESVTDIAIWRKTLADWQSHDWKPSNVPGMIERYKTPPPKFAPNGNGNGRHEPEPPAPKHRPIAGYRDNPDGSKTPIYK